MDIHTKFNIDDYAWYKYENKWYMIRIDNINVAIFCRDITGEQITSITYAGAPTEITERPSRQPRVVQRKWDAFSEFELYTKEEKEKAESE